MFCGTVFPVYCTDYVERVNALCGGNVEFLLLTRGDTYWPLGDESFYGEVLYVCMMMCQFLGKFADL